MIKASTFWHHVNANTFPKLKKFKISDVIHCIDHNINRDHPYGHVKFRLMQVLKTNFTSLIGNGLESLQFKLKKFDLRDLENELLYPSHIHDRTDQEPMDMLLKSIGDSFGNVYMNKNNPMRKNAKTRSVELSDNFILKIELVVDVNVDPLLPDLQFDGRRSYSSVDVHKINNLVGKNGFNSISDELLKIVSWLNALYNSFMFGFKLKFIHMNDDINISGVLKRAIKKHAVFQSTASCVVHNHVEEYDTAIILDTTFKSWNKGENNLSSLCCNMDPKYEFECRDCCSFPWIGF